MKLLLSIILVIAVSSLLATVVVADPGWILVDLGNWRIESRPLAVLLLVTVLAIALLLIKIAYRLIIYGPSAALSGVRSMQNSSQISKQTAQLIGALLIQDKATIEKLHRDGNFCPNELKKALDQALVLDAKDPNAMLLSKLSGYPRSRIEDALKRLYKQPAKW